MVLELALSSKKRDRTKENFARAVQRLMTHFNLGRHLGKFIVEVEKYVVVPVKVVEREVLRQIASHRTKTLVNY